MVSKIVCAHILGASNEALNEGTPNDHLALSNTQVKKATLSENMRHE